jgi:hypothetical protein
MRTNQTVPLFVAYLKPNGGNHTTTKIQDKTDRPQRIRIRRIVSTKPKIVPQHKTTKSSRP